MLPTVFIPSIIGNIFLTKTTPVKVSKICRANPIVVSMNINFPKIKNPFATPFGNFNSAQHMKIVKAIIGIKSKRRIFIENPATIPPIKHPNGIVEIPANIPLDKYFSSSFSIIPKATGIEKDKVVPIVALKNRPENIALSWVEANSWDNIYPPISLASIVPANIAGSAPIIL